MKLKLPLKNPTRHNHYLYHPRLSSFLPWLLKYRWIFFWSSGALKALGITKGRETSLTFLWPLKINHSVLTHAVMHRNLENIMVKSPDRSFCLFSLCWCVCCPLEPGRSPESVNQDTSPLRSVPSTGSASDSLWAANHRARRGLCSPHLTPPSPLLRPFGKACAVVSWLFFDLLHLSQCPQVTNGRISRTPVNRCCICTDAGIQAARENWGTT